MITDVGENELNKKVFIFGTTDLAENLFYHLIIENKQVDGFCINREYHSQESLFGKPVYIFEELQQLFPLYEIEFYVCVGYKKMNTYRKKVFDMIKSHGWKINSYRHNTAQIYSKHIGEGNLFFENVYVGMYSEIGEGNIFYTNSMVAHHTIIGNFNFFAISSSVAGKMIIENFNFFGNNSTTKDHIEIGNRVLVGANAYVDFNVWDGCVIVPGKSVILENKNSMDIL